MTPTAPARASAELRRSIAVPEGGALLRRLLVFLGPGYLVATGYMDPGNWATALAAGSKFGAALLFVAVLSSLMAIVLQSLSARLGVGAGLDLAEACRAHTPFPVAVGLWLLAEAGIFATDLAEVIGTAIGLQLLFGLPLAIGILVTALDAFLVLAFERLGFRKLELFVVATLLLIGLSFAAQLALARPDMRAVAQGLIPSRQFFTDPDMLYLGLGILGATVMPHNLFLHSFVVQTRAVGVSTEKKREAVRFAVIDSSIALLFAMLVNGAILILAAAAFHAHGLTEVSELGEAHRLIAPLLGEPLAATLFAVALIACGLNSTVTATLSGQIVMEGFIRLRLKPTTRRLVTRALAIAPAIAVTLSAGESATARLLVLSQVVLSLTLPFAMLPLIIFTARRGIMGALVAPRRTTLLAGAIAALIVGLNAKLVWDAIVGALA
ncbi:Nramp family divalent metal transporter [Methylocystis sp. MJC1]|uniref:Nramp family divalent metal transporter n=1 Tax=Methylocystis sp. MJC1 TaxID=2654282 RepID=UPI0013EC1EBB|nr:Nramp family divalent metal transporter [Methylocystis sp. MJC1]KAF2991800.1 Divalent metal cation transporter MntH [Methylocystis sp. MJC1]MBU6528903.1 Nramp family divalent metal transporter [Methylocystis sp. MJC1]UZX11787.1 Nramp family divalent metal transporter [Methylocystis sp. MJC1]